MSAPAASTLTRRRSAAARAARVRARASLRHRPASSPSSPRSTGSSDPCRTTTTARTSVVRASSLILQGRRVCQTTSGILYTHVTRACHYCFSCMMHVSLLRSRCEARTMYHPLQRRLRKGTRTRCQRRASSALVAETAVRTFGVTDVLGRVPSGSREGRVPSACITFFGLCN